MTEASYLGSVSDVSTLPFNNASDSTGYKQELRYWRAVVFGLGGAVVCVLGILCNVTAVVVLAKFKTTSSAPFLLICLACLDALYLLFMLVCENLSVMSKAGLITRHYVDVITPVYRYLYAIPFVAQTCISYTVLLISVERFVVVAWPFKAYTICSYGLPIRAEVC
ncbi:hypothetical protein Btru_001584 [Bulinus truncatus]|nr:hypothetical protein Btru_001584 [Bulinus truncatus]